uniref:RING-H2 finger protein ATL8-like n=1 Tax=Erigeron canadensis TaxID=72917 RepID=UPI001CB9C34F|nr:RING-H2 finger protein ATL8-like [Erigeron canadensis]
MTRPYRFLSTIDKPVAIADPPSAAAVESDFVVILAALLCALICVVGLIAVARCAWLRRASVASSTATQNPQVANKGLKKKVIEVLPKFIYDSKKVNKGSNNTCEKLLSNDCAICLAEYIDGDEIRVLPQCGHGFHVDCIDMWLGSHSSCPSCRQILVATVRCETCGGFPTKSIANKDRQHSTGSSSSSSLSSDCYLP